MKRFASLILCLVVGTTSLAKAEAVSDFRLDRVEIVRLFMHEVGQFSVSLKETDITPKRLSYILSNLPSTRSSPHHCAFFADTWYIRILADAKSGEGMWIETFSAGIDCKFQAEIHVHSAEDINGAGWDHGKHGSGMTTVVE